MVPHGMFNRADLEELTELVADAWTAGADRDWSVNAGTLEWSCTKTADHAVDCVFAPAYFLASRKVDEHGFSPPLDIVDGAARICDPIFTGALTGQHAYGQFFKDYKPVPW